MAGLATRVTAPVRALSQFVTEAWFELKRVVWPTREEAQSFTAVVIIAVTIVAIWVGSLDWICAALVTAFKVYGR